MNAKPWSAPSTIHHSSVMVDVWNWTKRVNRNSILKINLITPLNCHQPSCICSGECLTEFFLHRTDEKLHLKVQEHILVIKNKLALGGLCKTYLSEMKTLDEKSAEYSAKLCNQSGNYSKGELETAYVLGASENREL